ncbi:E3 ubiquitin-protein ligase CHFR isoform X3 [Stigmatopora argus]
MESHRRRGTPWGKLVKVDSNETGVLLFKRECTIGRKKGCDLAFPANKKISAKHCKIVHDENSGQVWLEDMSTNGTVINMSKLVKKQTHMLQNGDVIYFVYRKSQPKKNIAYVYHTLTTEETFLQDHQTGHSPDVLASSDMTLSVEPVMLTKAPRDLNEEEPQPSTSTSHLCFQLPLTAGTNRAGFHSGCKSQDVAQEREEALHSEPECKKRKTEVIPPTSGSSGNLLGQTSPVKTKTDKMEESLTCSICQELLYDCVSLQPCMHTFCAACYSGWMDISSNCPTCRAFVERIHKNYILNNLVEAYLIEHPEKSRSEEDMKSMDSRNKIKQDILAPPSEHFSDEDWSSEDLYDISDNDSDSSVLSPTPFMCRQCPGYRSEINQMPFANAASYWFPLMPPPMPPPPLPPPNISSDEGSATDGDSSVSSGNPAGPLEYRCQPQGDHLFCECCLEAMPDRRPELNSQQQCAQCQRHFCHIYWGCRRIGCQGCLAQFSELNLTEKCLDGVLNNNHYESEILKNYLTSRGKTWKDLLKEALHDLEEGKYCLPDGLNSVSANTIICVCCGLKVFTKLAYKYRQNIPTSELPATVLSRPDCYWGRNCRTQIKAHHARNFNHICEQTRFKS